MRSHTIGQSEIDGFRDVTRLFAIDQVLLRINIRRQLEHQPRRLTMQILPLGKEAQHRRIARDFCQNAQFDIGKIGD